MSAQSPLMRRRLAKINAYVEVARTLKPARLPAGPQLVRDGKAVVFDARARCLDVYVRAAGRWRKKLRLSGAAGLVPARCRAAAGALRVAYAPGAGGLRGEERLEWRFDADEREAYLVRSVTLRNAGTRAVRTRAETGCRYFPEGALSDFTFVSFKWMGRKTNLGRYPDPGKGYTSARAGNQLFFNASGGLYAGAAYLDTERDRVSETDKNGEQLFHHFALAAPCAIRPGATLSLTYVVFAGRGGEAHGGRLSNLLWRLNWARDPGTHVPRPTSVRCGPIT